MIEKLTISDNFEGDETLRITFTTAQRKKNMHTNEFFEILYVYEGHGILYTGRESTEINTRDFILIKPDTTYSVNSPSGKNDVLMRICRFIFTPDYLNSMCEEYSGIFTGNDYELCDILFNRRSACIRMSDDDALNIHSIMWLTAHEYNHFKIGSDIIINSSMLNLLICMTRLYEYQKNRIPPTLSTDKSLEEMKKYIRSNFAYDLTLEFLASQVHLSREYLSRAFKQYTGQTISDFILDVRMKRAQQMLRNPRQSITDISAYCGYKTIGNFQRAFKKYTGISPSEYRKLFKRE